MYLDNDITMIDVCIKCIININSKNVGSYFNLENNLIQTILFFLNIDLYIFQILFTIWKNKIPIKDIIH